MSSCMQSSSGRLVALVTAVVVAATPGISSAAAARQMSDGPAGRGALTVEQDGPRDLRLANDGDQALPLEGAGLRRLARTLRLDPASPCLTAGRLEAGASCGLRLRRAAGPRGAAPWSVRLAPGVRGELTMTNTGTAPLRLAGRAASSGARGLCPGLRELKPGASCALRVGAGARAGLDGSPAGLQPALSFSTQSQIAAWLAALGQVWLVIAIVCGLSPYTCHFTIDW